MSIKPSTFALAALGVLIVGLVLSIGTMPDLRDWLAGRVAVIGSVYTVTSTGYASSPYQTDSTPCYTAAGTVVRPGVVAANFLPIGTLIAIDEAPYDNRVFIVEDRTHQRYQHRLDIWFKATSEALEHGVRTLTVRVVGHGTPGQAIKLESATEPAEDTASQEVSPATIVEPSLLERASLRVESISRVFAQLIGANVNRFDVDCSQLNSSGSKSNADE